MRSNGVRVWCALVAAGLVLAAPPARGLTPQTPPPTQTPPPQNPPPQQPTFRSRVDTVSLDVSVTDKQGQPVTDLALEDFEVRENRQPQKLDTIKLIEVDDQAPPGPPVLSSAAQAREIAREDTRLIIVYLDDYHVRELNSLRVREQVARFIRELSGRDLVAVMYPLMEPEALTYSYDHDAVAAVISSFRGRKYDYTPRNAIEAQYVQYPAELQEQIRNSLVMESLAKLCRHLGTVRQGRKTVLMVSEGMMARLPPYVHTVGAPPFRQPTNQTAFATSDLLRDMSKVFEEAGRANTSIYTFDARGLGPEFGAEDNNMPIADMQRVEDERRRLQSESVDVLRSIADQTDGRAIMNRNDPSADFRQITRDTGTYYLLGYRSTLPPDGNFHRIEVKVKRPDVEVQARKGYWAVSEADLERAAPPPRVEAPRDVSSAIERLDASTDPNMRRSVRVWVGAADVTHERATVTVAWEAATETSQTDALERVDRISLTATSIAGTELFKGQVPRDPAALRPGGTVSFPATPGNIQLRIVAENARGLRLDTEERAYDVPKPSAASIVITDPAVYRGRTVRDIRLLREAASPLPVATRVFSNLERLLLRFQVVAPATAAPVVTVKMLNRGGGTTSELPAPTQRPDGRYDAEVPLNGLPGGVYLIEIGASVPGGTPASARQLVAVRISG